MYIVHSDAVFQVQPNDKPNYNSNNPLLNLLGLMEGAGLAAEREYYLGDDLQYLFPFKSLELYGPAGSDFNVLDPTRQDNKTDFQKQNIKSSVMTDTYLVRGWAKAGDWTGPFLHLSYRGGPDSVLSGLTGNKLGQTIKLWIKVGNSGALQGIPVPYDPETDRYEIELWGYPGDNLRGLLDKKGIDSLERGALMANPALIRGNHSDFNREGLDDRYMIEVAPDCTMHPILPLHIELAWSDANDKIFDSQGGANYHYEFNMFKRGWNNFLGVGISPNPHGGVGFLEYRNLASNYGRYEGRKELGRTIEPWNFNAFHTKSPSTTREDFFTVDYMDLHLLKAGCGIGLHRHRDNQEVFLLMDGRALMVVGDWCKMPERERCFEIRTLTPGHFALLKGGNFHGLMNTTDADISLFMFGGYD